MVPTSPPEPIWVNTTLQFVNFLCGMKVPIKDPDHGEAHINDLIWIRQFGTIHKKVTLYLNFVLPTSLNSLSLFRGENTKPLSLPPFHCHIYGRQGKVNKKFKDFACDQEHPIVRIAQRFNCWEPPNMSRRLSKTMFQTSGERTPWGVPLVTDWHPVVSPREAWTKWLVRL